MTNILVADFLVVIMIFLRIMGVFTAAPIFGNQSIPVIIRVLISAFIAYITFLTIDTTAIEIQPEFLPLAIFGFKEILTGLIIGFSLNLVFYGISFAGWIVGFNMGLSMANAFNPTTDIENNIIGEVFFIFAAIVFFLINGHHYIISAVVASFKVIPLGNFTLNEAAYILLLKYSAAVFVIAIKIASPIIVSYFLVIIGEGIIARVIPQIQVFFITQPLKVGLGFLLLSFAVPMYLYIFKQVLKSYEESLYNLLKAMGS